MIVGTPMLSFKGANEGSLYSLSVRRVEVLTLMKQGKVIMVVTRNAFYGIRIEVLAFKQYATKVPINALSEGIRLAPYKGGRGTNVSDRLTLEHAKRIQVRCLHGGGNITEQGKDLGNTKYKPNSVLFYKVKPETTPSLNRGYTTNSQNLVSETEEA